MASRPAPDPHPAVTIAVRVKPGASRPRVGGAHAGPHGAAIVVSVHAAAVDGKATEAARRALARALRVPAGDVSLRAGAASRDKLFVVAAPPTDLPERVAVLLADTR
jgi:uncharacterized protein